MSARKRSQETRDPYDPDSEPYEASQSPETLQSRKRPRTSHSTSPRGSTEDSDNTGARGAQRCVTLALDEDEEELELRATQVIQEKYSFTSDEPNIAAEHGILERIECYNFMCHDHLQVELGPLINFIVGKNGSGKSAVLTAITLCLGGKASATNRGQSLKSFIKEGRENATIVVRIKNQGDGAYMPDDYGKSIIVERHFSKNGTSGFKLKSENGRIISTKKAELDAIIDYFTLQFENPMNVLSQDMARQFLSSSSPAEKYKFFVKGVQLEQLDQDYRLIEESADQIEEKLKSKEQDIKILKGRRDAAKQKLDISDQHESLRNKVRNLRNQMAWAQVEEQERMRDALENELANVNDKVTEAEADLFNYDDAIREAESECEAAAEYVKQASINVENAQNAKAEVKALWDEQMGERHDLQAQQRQIKENIKATESRIKETQHKIDEENQRLADLSGGSYTRKQEELERAKQDAAETRKLYEEHKVDGSHLENLGDAGEKIKSIRNLVDKAKADVDQAEATLRNLDKEGNGKNSGFHEKMPALLKAIEEEQSFTRKPVGPIGHFISLLKPEWSSILENSLGATLNSFIVTSKRDMNTLTKVMQRVNCVSPIFIGSEGRLNTLHEPDSRFDTALRVLRIDNELVQRQLIINHGIEQMLLIENLEEASSVLFDGQRPKNVKRCYSINERDRRRGIHLSFSRTGEPSQAPVPIYNGHPRMKADRASQIRVQRNVVADLRRELSNREQELSSAKSHFESCKQARALYDKRTNELRIEVQKKQDHVEELEDALERQTREDGNLDVLQATLRELEEEKQINEGSLKDSGEAMSNMMKALKNTNQMISAKDAEISTLQEELAVAQSEELRFTEKRRQRFSDKNIAIDNIDSIKRDKARILQKKEEVSARILEFIQMASLVSPRVPITSGETTASLDKKLERLNKDIQRYNRELGASRDEIAAEATKTNNDYEQALKQVEEFRLLADVLKTTLKHRKKRWQIFRSHISSRAKAQFTYLLSERSFRGRLLTDHDNKLLDLQVEPDITKISEGRGARTLSGGEKSFSQVCLLLALWEAMGSPIRCLDEFDVYMDHINRKMAIDMLMLAARRSIGRQFILITPGSRAEITLAPDVRVKELAEPERGQTRLTFR